MWSAARSAKISMILCMPERVSGGDAKFQGICNGWNKWEGQGIFCHGRGSLPLSRGSAPGKELVSDFHGLRHAREDTVVAR